MKGAGLTRSMRRLTARSKYRAAQALWLLQHAPLTLSASSSMGSEMRVLSLLDQGNSSVMLLDKHRSYLYCLAELQETRLLCSEQSLGDALGVLIPTNTGKSASQVLIKVTAGDPRPLVQTWIHDESHLCEALELGRDILFLAHCRDPSIWHKLLQTMLKFDHHRSLLQTLLGLINTPDDFLLHVLNHPVNREERRAFAVSLFQRVLPYGQDVIDKASHIMDILKSKTTAPPSTATAAPVTGSVLKPSYASDRNASTLNITLADLASLSSSSDTSTGQGRLPSLSQLYSNISHSKAWLLERCIPVEGAHEWNDRPEDCALGLRQFGMLYEYFTSHILDAEEVEAFYQTSQHAFTYDIPVKRDWMSSEVYIVNYLTKLIDVSLQCPVSEVTYTCDDLHRSLLHTQHVDQVLRRHASACLTSLLAPCAASLFRPLMTYLLRSLPDLDSPQVASGNVTSDTPAVTHLLSQRVKMVIWTVFCAFADKADQNAFLTACDDVLLSEPTTTTAAAGAVLLPQTLLAQAAVCWDQSKVYETGAMVLFNWCLANNTTVK